MLIQSRQSQRLANLWLKFLPLRSSDEVYIARGSVLTRPVNIGRGTRFNGPTYMRGTGGVQIGNYCAIGHLCRLVTSNHGMGHPNMQFDLGRRLGIGPQREHKSGVKIGNNVWIGDSVIILPGVSVGNGAVIGAGSIVTRDVEPYSIYAGNPARKLSERFEDSVKDALDLVAWWEWDKERMKRAHELFGADLSKLPPGEAVTLIRRVAEESASNAS